LPAREEHQWLFHRVPTRSSGPRPFAPEAGSRAGSGVQSECSTARKPARAITSTCCRSSSTIIHFDHRAVTPLEARQTSGRRPKPIPPGSLRLEELRHASNTGTRNRARGHRC
jgi:hypothetical protein